MTVSSSVAALSHEAERLDNRSLDAFIAAILSMRVQRKTSDKQKEEAILLRKINKSLSIEQITRFRALNDKLSDDNITEQEYVELGILVEKIEKLNVTRLKHLTALAQLRHVTVRELMQQLGILNTTNV